MFLALQKEGEEWVTLVEVCNPACTHWGGIYQPLMLNFGHLDLVSALLWISFVILGKLLALFAPVFPIWYWEIISHYLRGKTLLWSTTLRGERELRAPSVSNTPEEWNSIATAEHTRESVCPSSVDCPLQSWARWFGRKIEQIRIARKTQDWQFIYCSVKWFNGFVPRLNKTNACKEHKFCFINKNHKHRIVCGFFGSKLEFWGPFQPELFHVTCQRWRILQIQIFRSVLFWTGQSIGMSFFLLSWQEILKGIPNVSSSAKCCEKCSN